VNRFTIFAEQLAGLLEPGERAVALQPATYTAGDEQLGEPPADLASTLVDTALGLPTDWSMRLASRVVAGVSIVGWPGCQALGLRTALDVAVADLLLTTHRLLVVEGVGTDQARITWAAPRTTVIRIERAPRFAQAGRIVLVFADSSALAVMAGVFTGGGARRFVEAWFA